MTKFIAKALLLVSLLLATVSAGVKLGDDKGADLLNGDFITGFESGIFLRKSPEQVDEYNCPKGHIQESEFQKVKQALPGIKGMMGLMNQGKDNELENMLESLVVFLDHVDELFGVFAPDYDGNDFCAGLTFGFAGSNLLYKIAEDIITHHLQSANLKN